MPLLLHHSTPHGTLSARTPPRQAKAAHRCNMANVVATFRDENSVVSFRALVDALDGIVADGFQHGLSPI